MTQASKTIEQHLADGANFLDDYELGIGNWAWGDSIFWQQGRVYDDKDSREAFDAMLEAGLTLVDTAEMYGFGRAERLLGRFMGEDGDGGGDEGQRRVVVATKYMPLPWRRGKGSLLRALDSSLLRLNMARVDLYQIHWPVPGLSIKMLMEALAEAVQRGMTRTVGVSNYNVMQMLHAQGVLAKHGVPLVSNQVEYSLLKRKPEHDGVLDACKRLGIKLIAYSPLAQGVLTGKYTPENPPSGARARLYPPELLERVQPLIKLMVEVGQAHGGKSPAQVALNWTICKGALPIPGARNAKQAQMNAEATGWRLNEDEVMALDEASAAVQM